MHQGQLYKIHMRVKWVNTNLLICDERHTLYVWVNQGNIGTPSPTMEADLHMKCLILERIKSILYKNEWIVPSQGLVNYLTYRMYVFSLFSKEWKRMKLTKSSFHVAWIFGWGNRVGGYILEIADLETKHHL